MTLQQILTGLNPQQRLRILRQAHAQGTQEATRALIEELNREIRSDVLVSDLRQEFDALMRTQIEKAEASGDNARADALRLEQITSYFYPDDIRRAAIATGDSRIIDKVIALYRADYKFKNGLVLDLLEHQGRQEEARAYALEAIAVLNSERHLERPGRWVNHGIDGLYLRLGMYKQAVDTLIEDFQFDAALNLAQKHLQGDELTAVYRIVYAAAENKGYHAGLPVQIRAAKLMGNKELEIRTKKKYVDLLMSDGRIGGIDLIREVGTSRQLRLMHDRCVAYCQQQKGEESQLSLARAAEEAYIDLQEKKYAEIAMNAYAQADEFTKAAEFARITGSDKIRQFEALVKLMEQ